MRLVRSMMIAVVLATSVFNAHAYADSESCGDQDGDGTLLGSTGHGAVDLLGACAVRPTDVSGPSGRPILVVDCGYATATDDRTHWNKSCGPTGFPCPPVAGNPHPHQFVTTLALTDPVVPIAQWCAGLNTPMPSAAALRQEVIRLLTAPQIGISPDTGTGLVNLKTLYWVTTPTQRNLGRAKLIGFPVQLRVKYLRTDFDFGDGTSGSLDNPGTPYDPGRDCGACTDRFGHTYRSPGQRTVTARTYWNAQYQVGGQPWTDIPGPVTAVQPATTTIAIQQAHSHLVSR